MIRYQVSAVLDISLERENQCIEYPLSKQGYQIFVIEMKDFGGI